MTKENFKAYVRVTRGALGVELPSLVAKADEIREHDAELARLFMGVAGAYGQVADYLRKRTER
jgi:hypothetical protein